MRVADDVSLSVDLLRGSEVVFLGVNEGTGLKVLNGHRDREWSTFDE